MRNLNYSMDHITVTGAENNDAVWGKDKINKGVIFKNCAPFMSA